jgi:hypothetical protein
MQLTLIRLTTLRVVLLVTPKIAIRAPEKEILSVSVPQILIVLPLGPATMGFVSMLVFVPRRKSNCATKLTLSSAGKAITVRSVVLPPVVASSQTSVSWLPALVALTAVTVSSRRDQTQEIFHRHSANLVNDLVSWDKMTRWSLSAEFPFQVFPSLPVLFVRLFLSSEVKFRFAN